MRNTATDAINYSLGHAWHNVAPGDKGRIQCQFMNCAENATICQHIGQPNSVSFSYWCEAHGSMWRERLPEFDMTDAANRLFIRILDDDGRRHPSPSRPTRVSTWSGPQWSRILDTVAGFDSHMGDVIYVTGPSVVYRVGMILDCYFPSLEHHVGAIKVTHVSNPANVMEGNSICFWNVDSELCPTSFPEGMILVSRG